MSREYCPKLAQVTCGLKKHHEGPCLPHDPGPPTEIPGLRPEAEYHRIEITVTPDPESVIKLTDEDWQRLALRILTYAKTELEIAHIKCRVDAVSNGELL